MKWPFTRVGLLVGLALLFATPRLVFAQCDPASKKWEGISQGDTDCTAPSDTQLAVGPNHVVEVTNEALLIGPKNHAQDPPILYDWVGFLAGTCQNHDKRLTDPRIKYDPASDRFFLVAVLGNYVNTDGTYHNGGWCLSVSATGDPGGMWHRYFIRLDDPAGHPGGFLYLDGERRRSFPDFPGLGVSSGLIVLTGQATNWGWEQGCLAMQYASVVTVINKTEPLYGGALIGAELLWPETATVFHLLQPAHPTALSQNDMSVAGWNLYDSAVDYCTTLATGTCGVVHLRAHSCNGSATLTTLSGSGTCTPLAVLAHQPGTTIRIQTNDGRALDAAETTDNHVWLAANDTCPGPVSCLRLLELANVASAPVIGQNFAWTSPTIDLYYPALAITSVNRLLIGFNRSSPTEYASLYYTMRTPTTPPNILNVPALVRAGEAPYIYYDLLGGADPNDPDSYRWGDYGGAHADPAYSNTVWIAGSYAKAGDQPCSTSSQGLGLWGTFIQGDL